ncbi:rubrerythrin-like domain-containing protein [Haladaptatus halobius]|nr:rubrerythrin-like domain-containing protein [Haladaptatus halobius]
MAERDPIDGEPPYTHECQDCGHRVEADDQPGECQNCGGPMQNISLPREK